MHLNRLDLNLLVALNALLTEQNVTRAAEQLSISQPAMSGSLTRLREHFQDELIRRVGRTMVLTPFGAHMAPRVRELLALASSVANTRPGFDPKTTDRNFTLVTSDYALAVFLPLLLPRIAAAAPRVALNAELRAPDQEARMASGMIDAVLQPRAMLSLDHPSLPLFEDEYVCIAWQGNTEIGEQFTLADFLRVGHIVRAIAMPNAITLVEARLIELGLRRNVVARVPSFEVLPRVIVGTQLVASVQGRLARLAATQYPIRILQHPVDIPPVEMTLQWPEFRNLDPGSVWLRDMMIAAAREMG